MRQPQSIVIVGRNGVGKSTLALQLMERATAKAIFVITYNGTPQIWRKYPVIDLSDREAVAKANGIVNVHAFRYESSAVKNDVFELLYKRVPQDCMLVFDDCRHYIPPNIYNAHFLKKILLDYRHKMLDLLFVCHSPDDVPNQIYNHTNALIVMPTEVLFNKASVKIGQASAIIAKQKELNTRYQQALVSKNKNARFGIYHIFVF